MFEAGQLLARIFVVIGGIHVGAWLLERLRKYFNIRDERVKRDKELEVLQAYNSHNPEYIELSRKVDYLISTHRNPSYIYPPLDVPMNNRQ